VTQRGFVSLLLAAWVFALPGTTWAQDSADLGPSYEFLKRQADLLFTYNKFDEAADSRVNATPASRMRRRRLDVSG